MAISLVKDRDSLLRGRVIRRQDQERERVVDSCVLAFGTAACRLTVVNVLVALIRTRLRAEVDCSISTALPA